MLRLFLSPATVRNDDANGGPANGNLGDKVDAVKMIIGVREVQDEEEPSGGPTEVDGT